MLTQQKISPAEQLKAIECFVTLTRNPVTFEAIYDLDEILRKTELGTISIEYLKSQPDVAALIEERYLPPVPNLNQLLTYPQNSLGYQFASHLVANHFDPQFYRKREIIDDLSYIMLRRSQTHDIYHIVTGFGTDASGEMGLQAFMLAQMRSPIAMVILASGIINKLCDPQTLNAYMQQMGRGWQMGLKAKPFMAQKWEEAWEKPLAQWQAELGIEAVAEGSDRAIAV